MKKYITTPIYYVNGKPHIGHTYTTIIADALKKYYILKGDKVLLLTGTDEHGQKIEESSKKLNIDTKKFVDNMSQNFRDLWDRFNIDYDIFMRTTNNEHKEAIKNIFYKMYQNGDIYKDLYKGFYCISCESFYSKLQLSDDNSCPDCGKSTKYIEEENYFFKLSKYQDKILQWYEEYPNCIIPSNKKNEMINFVKSGLKDLSITRSNFNWGIKLPKELDDNTSIVYVWLDALMNYITALGYPHNDIEYWKSSVSIQIVGKDILKFHSIYWPAFLISLDLPLPSHILAHGWWLYDGEKMSKSIGNIIDPIEIINSYNTDILRYFLLKEISLGSDGSYSESKLIEYNNELANSYGNLLSRTIGMHEKYFTLTDDLNTKIDKKSKHYINIKTKLEEASNFIDEFKLSQYIDVSMKMLNISNKLIEEISPWKIVKDDKETVKSLLSFNYNILIKVSILLYPIIPKSSINVLTLFKLDINSNIFDKFITKNLYITKFNINKIKPLFEKIDMKKVEQLKVEKDENIVNLIDISTFTKVDIRVGTIMEVFNIDKSDKLYKLSIDLGEKEYKEVVAGIKKHYTKSEELKGLQVCICYNLKPTKLMGIKSEGMILVAKSDDKLTLISPKDPVSNGAKIG